jgi:hypothetical protein
MIMQFDSGTDGFRADFPCAAVFDQFSEFDRIFEETFPAVESATEDLGAGPQFSFEAVPKPNGEPELNIELTWVTQRNRLLDWYGRTKDWAGAKREGDRLVRELGNGMREALSTQNGFIAEMSRTGSSHLELVDFSETAADSDFTVPVPREGLKDSSADHATHMTSNIAASERNAVYVRAAREIGTGDEEFKRRLSKLFEALYGRELLENWAGWVASTQTQGDKFTEWCKDRYEQTRDQLDERAALEDIITKRQSELRDILIDTLDRYTKKVVPCQELGLDPGLSEAIVTVERNAMRAVFNREVGSPMLARFEQAIAAAKGGK